MSTLFIILSIWFGLCTLIAILNAKFWQKHPDLEDLTYLELKAENKACINPVKEDTKHLGKMFLWVAIIIFIVALLCSCSRQLHTGYYTIEGVKGRTVNLKGVNGLYYFPSDTLKPGDRVYLKRVLREQDANVW